MKQQEGVPARHGGGNAPTDDQNAFDPTSPSGPTSGFACAALVVHESPGVEQMFEHTSAEHAVDEDTADFAIVPLRLDPVMVEAGLQEQPPQAGLEGQ